MSIYNTYYTKEEIARILEASQSKEINPFEKKLLDISDKLYIFDGLNRDEVQKTVGKVKFNKYDKGQVIINEKDEGEEIFFILSGKGAVVINGKKVVAIIDSGSMFGEMAFLTKKPRSATIIAYKENTTVISFQINTTILENTTECSLSKIYQNIALDLSKKLEMTNGK